MGMQHTKDRFLASAMWQPPFHYSTYTLQASASLDVSSLTQLYSSLCATPINSSSTPQLSQQAVANLYGKGLAAAAHLQRKAVKPDTLKTRQAAIRELADCLQSKQNACKRTVLTVTPEDILVYFQMTCWQPGTLLTTVNYLNTTLAKRITC